MYDTSMELDPESETNEDFPLLVANSLDFLRAVKNAVGDQACTDALNVLKPVLGPIWARAVFSEILRDGLGGKTIRIKYNNNASSLNFGSGNFIELIKEIRRTTGIGLGAAKALADTCRDGAEITVTPTANSFNAFAQPTYADIKRAAESFRSLGAIVRVI